MEFITNKLLGVSTNKMKSWDTVMCIFNIIRESEVYKNWINESPTLASFLNILLNFSPVTHI